jgi:RNA polymerase sigma-70 factor (ECF subfamily)
MDPSVAAAAAEARAIDAGLAQRAQDGNQEAFATLAFRQSPRLRAIASAQVADRTAIDDIVQEAFLRAWDRLPQLADAQQVGAWLAVIARNEAITWLRRNARLVATESMPDLVAPSAEEPDPRLAQLRHALRALRPAYREILALKYEANLDYEAIADTLGTTVANVEKRLYRARQALLERMPGSPR